MRRSGRVSPCVLFALFMIASVFVGCETETKHKVLSFFLDGVPPLETPKPEEIVGTPASQVIAPRVETPQPVLFTHKPFAESRCASCHDLVQGNRTDSTSVLCFQCHEDDKTTGTVVHAPVAGGECLICHDPHESAFKYLLPVATVDLCFDCHNRADVMNVGPHALMGDQGCSTCHNPHSSDSPVLMAFTEGGRVCFDCHRSSAAIAPDRLTHQPAKEGQCNGCHVSHSEGGKFHLAREGKALCDECHEIPVEEATMVHAPVATGACLTCHDPHGSPTMPNLLEELPELCWQCHDEVLMAGEVKHAVAEEGGCPQCHSPHGSKESLFLSEPISNLCATCHDGDVTNVGLHALMGDRGCTACHNPHSSDSPALLISTVGGPVCSDCHESSNVFTPALLTHQPAKDGQCGGCHVSHTQGGEFHLAREGKALCEKCHEIPEEEAAMVHAPVATGACLTCHDPHGSTITFNLLEELPELCWQCHDKEPMAGKEEHVAAEADNVVCTKCHSPHSSMKVQLLK